jgi:integrase
LRNLPSILFLFRSADKIRTTEILGDELRALRRLQQEQEPKSPFVFTSERGAPFTTAGFARMIERAGLEAKFAFKPYPHTLRHACGYALANRGHVSRLPKPQDL